MVGLPNRHHSCFWTHSHDQRVAVALEFQAVGAIVARNLGIGLVAVSIAAVVATKARVGTVIFIDDVVPEGVVAAARVECVLMDPVRIRVINGCIRYTSLSKLFGSRSKNLRAMSPKRYCCTASADLKQSTELPVRTRGNHILPTPFDGNALDVSICELAALMRLFLRETRLAGG